MENKYSMTAWPPGRLFFFIFIALSILELNSRRRFTRTGYRCYPFTAVHIDDATANIQSFFTAIKTGSLNIFREKTVFFLCHTYLNISGVAVTQSPGIIRKLEHALNNIDSIFSPGLSKDMRVRKILDPLFFNFKNRPVLSPAEKLHVI